MAGGLGVVDPLITGGATIIGAIIGVAPWFVSFLRKQPPRDIKRALEGNWTGVVQEEASDEGAEAKTYEVTWHIERKLTGLRVESTANHHQKGEKRTDSYLLQVRLLQDRFVEMSYFNRDGSLLNFGVQVIRVADNNETFHGRFVGHSADRSRLIHGTISARRSR